MFLEHWQASRHDHFLGEFVPGCVTGLAKVRPSSSHCSHLKAKIMLVLAQLVLGEAVLDIPRCHLVLCVSPSDLLADV